MSHGFSQLPPLNALKVFEAVTRHLNFRLAAEELGVTQGAVAQQIRGLEASLGLKLFERLPRSLALTGAGAGYAVSIRQAFELIDEATRTLRPEPNRLTLSVTPTFASRWMLPRLPGFTAAWPDIDLRVLASERLVQFHHEGVDLAVRYGRPPFGAGLDATLLFSQTVLAVVSPTLLAELGDPAESQNFQRYALVHDGHHLWPAFLAFIFPSLSLQHAHHLRFNQTALALEAAIGGQGMALTSPHFVQNDLASGRLVAAFSRQMALDAGWYLVWPKRPREQATVKAVRDWLLAQVNG
ncbi:LysR family transcriptional regulator [Pantoea sp. BIGb0393]|uniref:LysR substrate-binding domain-containing protein n=1 Tax=Pantoea nemavictus TaxID=2726955 RepID=A0ABU8PZC9_9GAMM|nr:MULTISPECIES: LysR substrate-binding domain-containing protein [Pantoea]KNC05581.1 LysR family transcriptional regulator [Pantoea sp. RIT-PI-b]MBA0039001.1 LysR family transcriptional regulator [Pantoea nemavictus]